ncbi:hypothetical protein Ccar_25875 (plasmid) [Clostridium carboxidivorans P7]|uniref:Chromosome partition protein smc n=1 Tax=Clostridium carboxidivorans P7 TaxID=536227 RepID=D6MEY0_9CLOT|nr:hypothetical protein [Clostridium carboxidivorans]ADO12123.1 chromosome partition protein smc [Clostridium carboxidivorans P7]AKN34258.1 hypothetical protein Ccar_25875 [Clostridium carboxidivorans P7]EFG87521.1 hypothetical protein CLCAR_3056 [Clostridium carboxidivorans P7]
MDTELKNILVKLLEGQSKLESEVKKNSIKLESIETKLNTIAEIQKAHMDQNEKAHTEVIKPLSEKVDVIELAVKDTSKDMQELKDKFDKVEKVTIQNTYDVAYLKSVK